MATVYVGDRFQISDLECCQYIVGDRFSTLLLGTCITKQVSIYNHQLNVVTNISAPHQASFKLYVGDEYNGADSVGGHEFYFVSTALTRSL